jgi:lantibiotic modifying enzyme
MRYLSTAYLMQVYMVKEIELLNNMEEVRIKTLLQNKNNIFSMMRGSSGPAKEFIAKIKDV